MVAVANTMGTNQRSFGVLTNGSYAMFEIMSFVKYLTELVRGLLTLRRSTIVSAARSHIVPAGGSVSRDAR